MSGPSETEAGNAPLPTSDAAANRDQERTVAQVDRTAAFAEAPPGIPPKFVYWALGVALIVSLGGLIGERVFSSTGINPVPTAPQRVATTVPVATPTFPMPNRSLNSSLGSFMGLRVLTPHSASPFTLTDQRSRPTPVPALPPRVVIVSFFNAACNDICPVVAAEIVQADANLGLAASDVEFVTVNTDPTALAQSAEAPVLSKTGLGALSNWHMVTGPLDTLNAVWKAYGVSISIDRKTGLEAHNDVMAFIDGRGDLRYGATPFADESASGTFSLPPAAIARWSQGIATYADRLVKQ